VTRARLALAAGAGGTALILLALALARRRLILVTVKGNSMAPAYREGDRLLLVRRARYGAGDVVMFRTPIENSPDVDWLVKRAAAVAGDPVPDDLRAHVREAVVPVGRLLVRSDAAHGLDSRRLGLIDARDVAGVVRVPRRAPAASPAGR
jgi:signal peptidase I